MCLNQAQGPKLDENCLDHVPYSKSIGNDRCTTCSQALRASDQPSTTPTSRRQRALATWPIYVFWSVYNSLAFSLQTWVYSVWIRLEIWQQLWWLMTGTRVIGSNLMVQPIQLSRVHRPYRVTKARAFRTKRRLLLLLTNVVASAL